MLPNLQILLRVLTFRVTGADLEQLRWPHLAVGLGFTWLVGMGRHWDNPRASLLQHLGVGSLVYVFMLALYLYLVVLPLRPERWRYRHLLTYITLTAPPALLYAIPVELWLHVGDAALVNLWFLAIVAAWRVGMYSVYLRRWAGFDGSVQFCATLLPLAVVVGALAFLNLDHAVLSLMAGLREDRTANDAAYTVLLLLTGLSILMSPILVSLYIAALATRRGKGPLRQDGGT